LQDKGAKFHGLAITGDLRGYCYISFEEEMALRVAGQMLGGMTVEKLDDMTKSALCEFSNMVLGNSATLLANEGTAIDITPPTPIEGDFIVTTPTTTIGIPFVVEDKKLFNLLLSVQEKVA
jgi:chemotaxis protein CheX